MQEAFLYYLWKHKAFVSSALKTTNNETIVIVGVGQHNTNAGPDFFNAKIRIDNQLWAGNVEMHVKSSDWYAHGHEIDTAYDNVILHVVWQHDTEVFRVNNTVIPTLQLKDYVAEDVLGTYSNLLHSKTWINCENDFNTIDDFLLKNWLERLYFERLEQKSKYIETQLLQTNNDWEAVLFVLLLKNFGLKANGDAFSSIAKSIDFNVVRKLQTEIITLEALLFGQAQLLEQDIEEQYFLDLKQRYRYLKRKFKLESQGVTALQFFRLRPPNFPTIRLSQFANLYTTEQHLFSKIIALNTQSAFYGLFNKGVSKFWQTHYTFTSVSKVSKKKLTKAFIDLLIVNTIVPIKFCYAKYQGKPIEASLLDLIKSIAAENNSVVNRFMKLRLLPKHALHSQALLQLKAHYCDKNKCLHCVVGNRLITKN